MDIIFENLKSGDRVKIKNRRGRMWNSEGEMDKFMGKEVEIYLAWKQNAIGKFNIVGGTFGVQNSNYYWFAEDDIQYVVQNDAYQIFN